ncbi:MAG: thermonuclease family protein [Pseudomonadota bacterium]
MTRTLFSLILLCLLSASPAQAGTARVIDGDTLDIGDTRYRIHGIDAPERGQRCGAGDDEWPCGARATEKLTDLTLGRDLRCEPLEDDGLGRTVAKCFAGDVDVGAAMVESGMAWAFVKYAEDYVRHEAQARAERRGVWRGVREAPWDYRAKRWRVAAQQAPEGCAIKGNISANGKIHHPPWSRYYNRTRISAARGERWFCSEREAIAASWRAPRNR